MTINANAPVVQAKEIEIEADIHTVWHVLTDINRWSEWNKRISHSTLQDSLAVGSCFTWQTNGSKIKSSIHTVSPQESFGWEGKAFGVSAIHNWYLEPTASGTKVRVEESMQGWIVKLLKNMMNSKLADDMQYWLERLKQECEK